MGAEPNRQADPLEAIRKVQLQIRAVPAVVPTASNDAGDRFKSFDLHVVGYMIEPVEYSQFVETMKVVRDYWRTSELPN